MAGERGVLMPRGKPPASKQRIAANAVLVLVVLIGVLIIVTNQGEMISGGSTSELISESSMNETGNSIVNGTAKIWFIDVGQGDSELIQIPTSNGYYNMLIDTGEASNEQGLAEFLENQGVVKINAFVLTHPHTDHIGGAAYIIENFEIGELYMPKISDDMVPTTRTYEELLDTMELKGLLATDIGNSTYIDAPIGSYFEVYSPLSGENITNLNNYSPVMKLVYGNTSFLFTGDAEKEIENSILESGIDIHADVLNVGHHGSSTSSTLNFINAVSPSYAVISCGEGNSYGHPHEETLYNLSEAGAEIYRTDELGTILFETDGDIITVSESLDIAA